MELAHIYRELGDEEQYYKWLISAAFSDDDGEAFLEIGELYFYGEYVDQDREKAYRYFAFALKKGVERAQHFMDFIDGKGMIGLKRTHAAAV